jgi:hypothetical protein
MPIWNLNLIRGLSSGHPDTKEIFMLEILLIVLLVILIL